MAEIDLAQGEARPERFYIKDDTGSAGQDLSAGDLTLTVVDAAGTVLFVKSSTNNTEIAILAQSGATLGYCDVLFAEADTVNLAPGVYYFDMWFTQASDDDRQVVPLSPFVVTEKARA